MTDQSIIEQERKDFEKWYQSQYSKKIDFKRYAPNSFHYDNEDIQENYETWIGCIEYYRHADRQSSQSEPVATVCHEAAKGNRGNPVIWFKSPTSLPDGTSLYAAPQQVQDKLAVYPPSGWKLVPIEPTEAMLNVVLNGTPYEGDNKELMREAYKIMLSASPTAPIESDK
jgi:hypothetical protein